MEGEKQSSNVESYRGTGVPRKGFVGFMNVDGTDGHRGLPLRVGNY